MSETNSNKSEKKSNYSVLSSVVKFSPFIVLIGAVALGGALGYIGFNFLGSLIGAIDGQTAATYYMASSVVNATSGVNASHTLNGIGSYYYLLALTVPNTYSLVGLFLGATTGTFVGIHHLESKVKEEAES